MPLEEQSAAKKCEILTTSPAFWSLSKEESSHPNLRVSKSDSTCCNQASVETLYVSPSFKMFDPVKETAVDKDSQKPDRPSIVQRGDENLRTLATWGKSKNPPWTNPLLKHLHSLLSASRPRFAPSFLSPPSAITICPPQRNFSMGKCLLLRANRQLAPPCGLQVLHWSSCSERFCWGTN